MSISAMDGPEYCLVFISFILTLIKKNYKSSLALSPPFMKNIFAERHTGYYLRDGNDSQLPNLHTTTY